MNLTGEIGTVLKEFLDAYRDFDWNRVDIKLRIKVKVSKLRDDVVDAVKAAGLEVDANVIPVESKIVLPWISGWIHPRELENLLSLSDVEFVDFDLIVTAEEV